MFRNNKPSGFVNEGLEVCEGSESREVDRATTNIEITRAKYDQKRLHEDMGYYVKPSTKSCEFLFSLTYFGNQGETTL
jgi:hypothetical protein